MLNAFPLFAIHKTNLKPNLKPNQAGKTCIIIKKYFSVQVLIASEAIIICASF